MSALVELVGGLLASTGTAILARWTGAVGALPLLGLAAVLVIALPVVRLWGVGRHEHVPPPLAHVHAGD